MSKIEYIKRLARKQLAKNNYLDYCQYVHGESWFVGKHIKLVCETVEQLIERQIPENILIISMPPQHGKSQSVSEILPSYYLGKYPDKRIIEVSYGDDLAVRFGKRNKQKIKEFGKDLFDIELAKDSQSNTDFSIAGHKGSMISRGIMAGLTGNPGDLIIIDDPLKNRQEAESENHRERIWSEFLDSIYSRLSAKGVIILIMTRWHEDDLAGRILREMPQKCIEINIPLEAEENDILGRKPGDSLFPEIGKDNDWLAEFKKVYMSKEGKRSWNALYQGRPDSAEGNLIPINDFQYYDIPPEKFDQILQSWDCTFKNSDGSDFVVGQVWGRKGPNKYLLDMVRARMDFTETMKAIIYITQKWPEAYIKLIEDKANGSAIITTLGQRIEGIMPINPEGSKLARVQSILPQIECHNVYLPRHAGWLSDFVQECSKFPLGVHDDMVDSMSQALNKMRNHYELPTEEPKKELPYALQTDNFEGSDYISW